MRNFHPPGHVGLNLVNSIGHISLGAASAIDVGLDLHHTSAIAAGAVRQNC